MFAAPRARPRRRVVAEFGSDDEGMVFREQHPLGCGRKGKRYHLYDRIEPLVDCISDMHKAISQLRSWTMVARGLRKSAKAQLASVISSQNAMRHSVLCVACGTTNPSKLKVDKESFLVCDCGAVNGRSGYGDDYSESRDAQRRRGEGPSCGAPGGRMPATVPSAEQRRRGMGAAMHISDRATAPVESDLPPRVKSKLQSVVEHIDRLAARLAPIDHEVVAEVRRTADRVMRVSHRHSKHCCKSACTLNICDRPPQVIGAKCFVYAVEKLCSGTGIAGVSKQTLASLHQRVRNSHLFSLRENNVQHEGCAAAIAAIDAEDFELTRACAHVKAGKREREEDAKKVHLKRLSSGGLNGSAQASKLTKIRNAIADSDFGFEPGVSAEAIRLLVQSSDLAMAIKTGTVTSSSLGDPAMAYVLMRAVAEREGGACSSVVPASAGLEGVDVHKLVAELRAILPEATIDDDDGLF